MKHESFKDDIDAMSEDETAKDMVLLEPITSEEIIYDQEDTEEEDVEDESGIVESGDVTKLVVNLSCPQINEKYKCALNAKNGAVSKKGNGEIGCVSEHDAVRRKHLLDPLQFTQHVTKRAKTYGKKTENGGSATDKNPTKIDENRRKIERNDAAEMVIDNIDNHPDITTFIYKGEEYIQMPKRVYLKQRTKLDADIKLYQTATQKIKSVVDQLEQTIKD